MDASTQENVVLPQNQPILPEQPRQNNFLVILLSILLLISVGVAGFFAYQTQMLVKELTAMKSASTPVSSEELKNDPASDWKTYSNSKYGLSLKYPSDWTIKTDPIYSTNPRLVTFDTKMSTNLQPMEYQNREFFIAHHNNIKDMASWIAENYQGATVVNNIKINNNDFLVINGGIQARAREYAIKIGENSYLRFVLEPVDKEDEFDELFDQILSTFKFTESDPTGDWKTYTNTSSNYSIRYPSDWKIDNQSAGSMGATVPDAGYIQIGYGNAVSGVLGIEELQMIPPSEEANLNSTKVVGDLTLRCNGKFTTDTKTWCWIKVPNMNKYLSIHVFKNTNEEMNDLLDQILSTFKFIN